MITCYPIWTTTPRAVIRHTIHRITHHTLRHALVATVRIVCVAVPAWIATPSPAAAPSVPEPFVMPPPMLPWPGDEVPWGWGAGDLGGPSDNDQLSRRLSTMRTTSPEHRTEPVTTGGGEQSDFTSRTLPIGANQPVPEPWGVAVLGLSLVVLGIVKGVKR